MGSATGRIAMAHRDRKQPDTKLHKILFLARAIAEREHDLSAA